MIQRVPYWPLIDFQWYLIVAYYKIYKNIDVNCLDLEKNAQKKFCNGKKSKQTRKLCNICNCKVQTAQKEEKHRINLNLLLCIHERKFFLLIYVLYIFKSWLTLGPWLLRISVVQFSLVHIIKKYPGYSNFKFWLQMT